jgi:hypothetical protein
MIVSKTNVHPTMAGSVACNALVMLAVAVGAIETGIWAGTGAATGTGTGAGTGVASL